MRETDLRLYKQRGRGGIAFKYSYAAVNSRVVFLPKTGHGIICNKPLSKTGSPGEVGAVIVSRSGKKYTGICLDFASSLGFCAEHAAIAEMLKSRESEIALVVAVYQDGAVLPPCGRCREMMWQLSDSNVDTLVILAPNRAVALRELLPFR